MLKNSLGNKKVNKIWSKKQYVLTFFFQKKVWVEKILTKKNWVKKNLGQKNGGLKKCWPKKYQPMLENNIFIRSCFDTICLRRDETTRRKTENSAYSVQLQLQLPIGTELGKINKIFWQLVT